MPPPVVYVVVALVGVAAAAYAFKEFVYEPHIAPTLETWAEDFLERRRTARNRQASAVPVPASRRRRRDSATSSHPSQDNGDTPLNKSRGRNVRERASGSNDLAAEAYELDGLASQEVNEWRNEVLRSQERGNEGLRRRRMDKSSHDVDGFDSMSTTLDESFTSLTHTPLASTHVISNVSSPITPSTASLPPTPSGRLRSHSESTTTQGEANTLFAAPPSPPSSIHDLPREASLGTMAQTPRPDQVHSPSSPSSVTPLAIPNASSSTRRSPANDNAPFPLPFTPTYQVVVDDSPFGPLLPDTPRSSAELYGERPFSPIARVMVSSSGSSSVSKGTLSSRANSVSSSRMLGNSGTLRRGSGLVNEVVMGNSDSGSDREDTQQTSPIELVPSSADNGTLASIASLSERYPAPPTPPVVVSPPASSIGIVSAPSSPRSGGSEVVINDFTEFQSLLQTQTVPAVPMLRVSSDHSSRSQSRSPVHSATSPAFSYASFLSPSVSRAPSESEGDEFMSVAGDESDWGVAPLTPGGRTGPVPDSANNPFLIFEHVSSPGDVRGNGSEHGVESEGSEVVLSDLGHETGSEVGSDESWGSARGH